MQDPHELPNLLRRKHTLHPSRTHIRKRRLIQPRGVHIPLFRQTIHHQIDKLNLIPGRLPTDQEAVERREATREPWRQMFFGIEIGKLGDEERNLPCVLFDD